MRVDLDKPVESKENTFEARCFNTAVEISSFADNDGELQVEGTLEKEKGLGSGNKELAKAAEDLMKYEKSLQTTEKALDKSEK